MKLYPYRIALLSVGMIALFSALWGGLLRLGLNMPIHYPPLAHFHGPLMISGFLGTLIGIERAVAVGRPWAYGIPALTAAGAITLILGFSKDLSAIFMVLSSLILVLLFLTLYLRQIALFTLTMGIGAILWLVGNVLWLTKNSIEHVVMWWGGFLVLTIAGERLELARLRILSSLAKQSFLAGISLLSGGLALTIISFKFGVRLTGVGLLVLGIWLLIYDIARQTVRQSGLTRFIAVTLLLGHLWLTFAGILAISVGAEMSFFSYDALLHSLFLGFVFSMIFGHAPIIFPAILGKPLAYHPRFYLHVGLLHLSLILRMGSDLTESISGQQWAGQLNAIVILLFLANTIYSMLSNRNLEIS